MPVNVLVDENDIPIVLPIPMFDKIRKLENASECLMVYCFYYYTAKWQKTNQIKCTVAYIQKGTNLTERKVTKARKALKELGLIEDIKDGLRGRHYVKIKFIWKNESVDDLKKSGISKDQHFSRTLQIQEPCKSKNLENCGTNALSTNKNINALSTDSSSGADSGESCALTEKTKEKSKKRNPVLSEDSIGASDEASDSISDLSRKRNIIISRWNKLADKMKFPKVRKPSTYYPLIDARLRSFPKKSDWDDFFRAIEESPLLAKESWWHFEGAFRNDKRFEAVCNKWMDSRLKEKYEGKTPSNSYTGGERDRQVIEELRKKQITSNRRNEDESY